MSLNYSGTTDDFYVHDHGVETVYLRLRDTYSGL